MTNAEARFSVALRPQKPQGSLGRKAQDGHLDFHTAPDLLTTEAVRTDYYGRGAQMMMMMMMMMMMVMMMMK